MSKAGVLAGLVTTNAPADGSPTIKRKGYHWFEYSGDPVAFVTSWTYPVHVTDSFEVGHSAQEGEVITWPPLEFEVAQEVVAGELLVTQAFVSHTQPLEEFEVAHESVAGELIVVQAFVSHTQPPEEFEVTHEIIAGDLIVVQSFIAHTQPPDEFEVTHDIIAGILTTV